VPVKTNRPGDVKSRPKGHESKDRAVIESKDNLKRVKNKIGEEMIRGGIETFLQANPEVEK